MLPNLVARRFLGLGHLDMSKLASDHHAARPSNKIKEVNFIMNKKDSISFNQAVVFITIVILTKKKIKRKKFCHQKKISFVIKKKLSRVWSILCCTLCCRYLERVCRRTVSITNKLSSFKFNLFISVFFCVI